MSDIKCIIVPVDLQRHTDRLVEFAVNIAAKLESEICLFHGIEYSDMGELANTGEAVFAHLSSEDFNSARVYHARQILEKICRDLVGRCKQCKTKVAVGYVVDSIVEYAKGENADLIIIGTHGKRGLEKVLLGSVAERVIKRAHCPILVMNPYR